jgi:transposase-like protein
MKKRTYSKEFKLSVLAELESGKSVAQVCTEKNVKSAVVYKWKSLHNENPHSAFSGRGNKSSVETELNEYKRLVGQLYAENTFLKRVQKSLQETLTEQKIKERRGYSK